MTRSRSEIRPTYCCRLGWNLSGFVRRQRWTNHEEYNSFSDLCDKGKGVAISTTLQEAPLTLKPQPAMWHHTYYLAISSSPPCACASSSLTRAFPSFLRAHLYFRAARPHLATAADRTLSCEHLPAAGIAPARLPHPGYSRLLHLNELSTVPGSSPFKAELFRIPPLCAEQTRVQSDRQWSWKSRRSTWRWAVNPLG